MKTWLNRRFGGALIDMVQYEAADDLRGDGRSHYTDNYLNEIAAGLHESQTDHIGAQYALLIVSRQIFNNPQIEPSDQEAPDQEAADDSPRTKVDVEFQNLPSTDASISGKCQTGEIRDHGAAAAHLRLVWPKRPRDERNRHFFKRPPMRVIDKAIAQPIDCIANEKVLIEPPFDHFPLLAIVAIEPLELVEYVQEALDALSHPDLLDPDRFSQLRT